MNEVTLSGAFSTATPRDAARFACLGDEQHGLAILHPRPGTGGLPVVFGPDPRPPPPSDDETGPIVVTGRLVSPLVAYEVHGRRQLFQPCWVQVDTFGPVDTTDRAPNRVSLRGTVVGLRAPWHRGGRHLVNAAVVVPDDRALSGQVLVSLHVLLRGERSPAWLRTGLRVTVSDARLVVSRYAVAGRSREACAVECPEVALAPGS